MFLSPNLVASFKAQSPSLLCGHNRGIPSVTRTKENSGLSVSNSPRFCTYLQTPRYQTLSGNNGFFQPKPSLTWWFYLAALNSYPVNKEPMHRASDFLSQSWT